MNKLDKQFGEMMKGGINLNSPSSDFTLKVMSRVYAEAALKPKPVLVDYQPVISKKAWIILISAFAVLIVYIMSTGQSAPQAEGGIISNLFGKLTAANNEGATSVLKAGMGIFKTIPPIAYLIVISSLALWTIDSVLQRIRHQSAQIQ